MRLVGLLPSGRIDSSVNNHQLLLPKSSIGTSLSRIFFSGNDIGLALDDSLGHLLVVHLTNQGRVNTAFGVGGITSFSDPRAQLPAGLAAAADGSLFVAANPFAPHASSHPDVPNTTGLAAFHLTAAAKLDTSFGAKGLTLTADRLSSPANVSAAQADVLTDGRILVIGHEEHNTPLFAFNRATSPSATLLTPSQTKRFTARASCLSRTSSIPRTGPPASATSRCIPTAASSSQGHRVSITSSPSSSMPSPSKAMMTPRTPRAFQN